MGVEPDYTAWRFWFDVFQTAGVLALGAYSWWVNRKKAVEKRFAAIESTFEKRCTARKEKIETLEKDRDALLIKMEYMPSHQDIQKMHERLDGLQNTMSTMAGRLEGINRAVDLMNEYLLNQSGKG